MQAMQVMSALAQPTRLEVFRLLVGAAPCGMAAGQLAAATGTAPNTMSAHLAILSRAGVVRSERSGRIVTYRAETGSVRELATFLTNECARDAREPGGASRREPRR